MLPTQMNVQFVTQLMHMYGKPKKKLFKPPQNKKYIKKKEDGNFRVL